MKNRLRKLSPTAFDLWESNPEEFYLKYLADVRPPKIPQTRPMSIGSAFDAYVKSFLNTELKANIPKFSFEELFEAQVEPQNRDWAITEGRYAFECYRLSGALTDLMLDMEGLDGGPRMELDVTGDVLGVPVGGRPDLYYRLMAGGHVLLDWKVNGYCAKTPKSPSKGYLCVRDGWPVAPDAEAGALAALAGGQWHSYRRTASHGTSHKDCMEIRHKGIKVNGMIRMEQVDPKWAAQLCFYMWSLGEPIGGDFVVGIDQLCCGPTMFRPAIRVAKHRCLITPIWQEQLAARIQRCWRHVYQTDPNVLPHVFADLSKEESDKKCLQYEGIAASFASTETPEDEWFNKSMRKA